MDGQAGGRFGPGMLFLALSGPLQKCQCSTCCCCVVCSWRLPSLSAPLSFEIFSVDSPFLMTSTWNKKCVIQI